MLDDGSTVVEYDIPYCYFSHVFFISAKLNCAAFTAGIIEAVLNGANFVSECCF